MSSAKGQSLRLWGGRFSGETDPLMVKYNASISFDKRMCLADVRGSVEYSRALHRCGVITEEEQRAIERGLGDVEREWRAGTFVIADDDEDIHTANERRLTELIGPVAGKLHTGRRYGVDLAGDRRRVSSVTPRAAGTTRSRPMCDCG